MHKTSWQSRRHFGIASALSLAWGLFGLAAIGTAADAPPNIILCMADDQGWGDVAYNGNTVLKTPILD